MCFAELCFAVVGSAQCPYPACGPRVPLEKFEKLVFVLLLHVFSPDSDRDLAAAIHCWLFSQALVEALFVIAKKLRSQC